MKKRNQALSLKELCRRLGLVIAQRYSRGDVRKRCRLIALPFKSIEAELIHNGMLDPDGKSELPF